MQLKQLVLRNFRNYVDEAITFSPGVNLIYGKNGAGKTNLLEALYLLSTGRSFRTAHLTDLIRTDSSHFYIEAQFEKDGINQSLSIGLNGKNRKIHHNAATLSNFSHLLGILPSVLYAPTDSQLVAGAPIDRRRFLNIQLAQCDPLYVHHLMRYHKAMKNRNALLKAKTEKSLDSWEEMMAHSAVYLMEKRAALIEGLKPKLQEFTKVLSDENDFFDLVYAPSISMKHLDQLQTIFQKGRKKEFLLGTTLNGPHRDDFLISYNKTEAKIYASEGQKRTCVAALKLSERDRLTKEEALLSIDDFGIHLDERRKSLLHTAISSVGQVFLTVPSDEFIGEVAHDRFLYVEGGTVTSDQLYVGKVY
ncbi:MAG: DNA replication/repair protein RecF [Simkania sp.]|nr:DNA replication/repair protein RecF [Simkania sp.]